jgi:cerevisin
MLKPGVDSRSLLKHIDFLQFMEGASPLVSNSGSSVKDVYNGPKMKGYAGVFSDASVEFIRAQPEVEYIEQDQIVWTSSREMQRSAPWVRAGTDSLITFSNRHFPGTRPYKPS